MELKLIKIKQPDDANMILGQSHFIKTVEDLYEALVNNVPGIKFGLGFVESSGACKVRSEGNDREKKAGAGLLPSAAGSGEAVAARQVQPWMLKVARLNGGAWNGIELLYPKNLAGMFMKLMGGKAALTAIAGTMLAVSGFGMLDMQSRGGYGAVPVQRAAPFQMSANPERSQAQAVPEKPASSSLSMVSGVNSGLYGAPAAQGQEQAAPAKDPEAAGKTSADEQAAGADPAQMLAAQEQTAARMVAAAPGKFSQGSRLNGGAGYSSGIGQGFKQPLGLNSPAAGQAKAFKNVPKARISRAATPSSGGPLSMRGQNARRLERMNRAMGPTRGGNPETGAAIHTEQWSNAQQPGNSLESAPSRPALTTAGADKPEGGPIQQPAVAPAQQPAQAPPVGSGENATPADLQKLIDTATMMLMAAAALTMLAFAVVTGTFGFANQIGVGEAIAWVAAGLSAIVAALGVAIMIKGQILQGAIFTATGALSAYYAWSSIISDPKCAFTDHLIYSLASSVGGAVVGQMLGKSKLDK